MKILVGALKKNVASQKLYVEAWNTLTDAPVTGDAANITAQISKDEAANASTNDANPTEQDSADHPGVYVFDLTQTETNADRIIITATSVTANVRIEKTMIYTAADPASGVICASLATQAKADVNAEVDSAIADARLDEILAADSDIDGAAPPTVGSVIHELMSKTAGSFTFDQTTDSLEAIRDKAADVETDTQDIQGRIPAALVGGRIDASAGAVNASATAAAQLAKAAIGIVSGAAIAGTLSTTQMTTDLTEATDGHYIGGTIIWTSGVLAGQRAAVTGYLGSTKRLTYSAVTDAPSATDTFVIV